MILIGSCLIMRIPNPAANDAQQVSMALATAFACYSAVMSRRDFERGGFDIAALDWSRAPRHYGVTFCLAAVESGNIAIPQ
jgi:hypothetical protein